MTGGGRLRAAGLLCLIIAAATLPSACDDDPSPGGAGSADPSGAGRSSVAGAGPSEAASSAEPRSAPARRFVAQANAACVGFKSAAPAKAPRRPGELPSYAREMLPVTAATVSQLRSSNVPATQRRAVRRLGAAQEALMTLYQEAVAGPAAAKNGLFSLVSAQERTVRGLARSASLPACVPPGD